MSNYINGPYGTAEYEDFTEGLTGDASNAKPGDAPTCVRAGPPSAGTVYYPNYQLSFNLGPTDFGLKVGDDLTDTLNNLSNFKVSPKQVITAPNGDILLNIPERGIPDGLLGWATLFVYIFVSYFTFSSTRVYNVSITPIQTPPTSTSDNITNQNLLGVGIPTGAMGSTTKGFTSGVTISFCIHNNTNANDILDNDVLPAVILGQWMKFYLQGFVSGQKAGWRDENQGRIEPDAQIPENVPLSALFSNDPANSQNLILMNGIPWVPLNFNSVKGSNTSLISILTRPEGLTMQPPQITNRGIPELTKYEKFTSEISNIFKRIRNRKVTEHLDGGAVSKLDGKQLPTTVFGTPIFEECAQYLTPMYIAPWCFTPKTNQSPATPKSNSTITFTLTPDDFDLDNQKTTTLYNIWMAMQAYITGSTSFTLFNTPSTLSPSVVGDNGTGARGFINSLLDVYSEILQVSSNRFELKSVFPVNNKGDEIKNLSAADTFTNIQITIDVNNTVGDEPNDFLDSAILSTWLINYWTSYKGGDESLPLFIPPPVNILFNNVPLNPGRGPAEMPQVKQSYTIAYEPLYNAQKSNTVLPHYKTIMTNPVAKFTGSSTINPNMIKLAKRIKNLKLIIKDKVMNFEKFKNFNRRLIENATGSISTSGGSSTAGEPTTPTTQPSVPPTLSTPGSSTTYSILDYIFQFSYITCFLAAVLLSISQLTGWDFIQLTLNDSLTNYIYIYVGICSIVALFSWFNTSIWYIDTSIVNPSNVAASKSKISF